MRDLHNWQKMPAVQAALSTLQLLQGALCDVVSAENVSRETIGISSRPL